MKKYVFKPYNDNFPHLFEKEKNRIAQFLSGDYKIEHIGSTAVPGLGGKGIIDIMIAVSKQNVKEYSKNLQKVGYNYVEQSHIEQRLFHWQDLHDDIEHLRRYHVHVTYPDSSDWKNAIAFRDYLRTHPDDLNRYAVMKQKAAEEANENTEMYMKLKSDVIKEILIKALNGF